LDHLRPACITWPLHEIGQEMDAYGERVHFDHELQHASPVGNDSSENIDMFASSPEFQHGHEYLYHAMGEENMRPVPLMCGHTTHTVSQSQETYDYNVNNDERLHALFQASAAPSAAAGTNHGQRRLSEIEDNLHGVQRKLGVIGEHFSAFSNALERLLLGTGTAPSGSSHILPPVASQGVSNSLFSANASEVPSIMPPGPLRVPASHGLDMLHPTASGNLFCAVGSDAAPGIMPPGPLRVPASHGLDMLHPTASGNLFCAEALDAAPGIMPPDPLRVAASHGLHMLHPTASGNLFCAGALDAAPGILPRDPLCAASGTLFSSDASDAAPGILPRDPLCAASGTLFSSDASDAAPGILPRDPLCAASGTLFSSDASDAAPGILPPDPLRVAAYSAQEVLSSSIAPCPLATNDISRTLSSSTKTGCVGTQETKTHVDQKQEYEMLSFREEIIDGRRWPLRITSKMSTDRETHYNISKGGNLTFTFSSQELEAETVESTSVYYATTEKNETARSVRRKHSLTLAELQRRNSRLDKIEKVGERSKFKKNTFLNVGDATTKKPRTRSQSQDGKL